MPDDINASSAFNEPGQLWDSNAVPRRPTILQQLPREVAADARPSETSGRVLRQIGATTQELNAGRITDSKEEVPQRPLFGSFSLLRAARVAHQYRVGLWDRNNLPSYLGSSTAPDPSPAELEEQYNDMLLFNYLPESMTPSFTDFQDMASPQRRIARLVTIFTRVAVSPDEVMSTEVVNVEKIAAAPPFAEKAQSRCNEMQKFFREQAPLTFTAEQYNNAR